MRKPLRDRRYDGPVEPGMAFTAPDNDGKLGYRRVKVVARYDDETWILEELPGRIRTKVGRLTKCPEINLRIVFQPEDAAPAASQPTKLEGWLARAEALKVDEYPELWRQP